MRRSEVVNIIQRKYRGYAGAVIARLQSHGPLTEPDWRWREDADAWTSFATFTNREERIVDGAYVANEWENTEAERLVVGLIEELMGDMADSEVDLLWLMSGHAFDDHVRVSAADKRSAVADELYDRVYQLVRSERIYPEDDRLEDDEPGE